LSFDDISSVYMVSNVNPAIPGIGGTGLFILSLWEELRKMGLDVILLGSATDRKAQNAFKRIIKPSRSTWLTDLRMSKAAMTNKIPNLAIIHAHRPDHLLPFLINNPGNPSILTLHGNPKKAFREKNSRIESFSYSKIENIVIKKVNKVIFVDHSSRVEYIRTYPWLEGKSTVIPIGIDPKMFYPTGNIKARKMMGISDDEKLILMVSRIDREKRIDLGIEAFNELRKSYNNTHMIIIGDGPMLDGLKKKNLHNKKIHFLGGRTRKELNDWYNSADVFLLTSEYEGLPTTVLESLACNTPVISTPVGDVHLVIEEGVNGVILKKDDKYSIMKSLENIILGQLKGPIKGLNTSYYYNDIAIKYIGAYREILKEG